jgi:hypothetical protein
MYAELAQYVAPKRRALDVSADPVQPVTIRIGIAQEPPHIESRQE